MFSKYVNDDIMMINVNWFIDDYIKEKKVMVYI